LPTLFRSSSRVSEGQIFRLRHASVGRQRKRKQPCERICIARIGHRVRASSGPDGRTVAVQTGVVPDLGALLSVNRQETVTPCGWRRLILDHVEHRKSWTVPTDRFDRVKAVAFGPSCRITHARPASGRTVIADGVNRRKNRCERPEGCWR